MACRDLAQAAVSTLLLHLQVDQSTAPSNPHIATRLILRQTTGIPVRSPG
jgi:hypothetical protein